MLSPEARSQERWKRVRITFRYLRGGRGRKRTKKRCKTRRSLVGDSMLLWAVCGPGHQGIQSTVDDWVSSHQGTAAPHGMQHHETIRRLPVPRTIGTTSSKRATTNERLGSYPQIHLPSFSLVFLSYAFRGTPLPQSDSDGLQVGDWSLGFRLIQHRRHWQMITIRLPDNHKDPAPDMHNERERPSPGLMLMRVTRA